jgi:hypothetical protein
MAVVKSPKNNKRKNLWIAKYSTSIKNNGFDDNFGFKPGYWTKRRPPGCYYDSSNNVNMYMYNMHLKSKQKCNRFHKCICKIKKCRQCPINTYREGGINPTCMPCPVDRPFTKLNSKQDSKKSCSVDLLL